MAPSLAESWTVSPDQWCLVDCARLKFHNGDPFTAEDVKFSFRRYKLNILQEKVREVEIVDPYRVRFHLHRP
jgi:peptide/nickel transport system substrate-binding protein